MAGLMRGDSRKQGAVVAILQKLKGSDSANQMAESNDRFTSVPTSDDGTELDVDPALGAATLELMESIKMSDPKSFKRTLVAFIQMVMDAAPEDEES